MAHPYLSRSLLKNTPQIPLTKDTYYAESGNPVIEDQNVVYDLPGSRDDSDELKNEIIKHLKNLKDEIGLCLLCLL